MAFDPSKPSEVVAAFDPSLPSDVVSAPSFDPSQPSEIVEAPRFDPSQPSETVDEGPSVGQIVKGLGAEIGISASGSLGGAAIGTAVAGPIGTIPGAVIGGFGSGLVGSLAAQEIEDQEDISWGRAIAAATINAIPFGVGAAAKGTVKAGTAIAKEAVKGAGFGATDATLRAIIDEDRMPTAEELGTATGLGAIFGGAVGAVGQKIAKRIEGKRIAEIDKAVARGDIGEDELLGLAKAGGITEEKAKELIEVSKTATVEKAALEGVISRDIGGMAEVMASVMPSKFVPENVSQKIIDFRRTIDEAVDLSSRVDMQLRKAEVKHPNIRDDFNKFLDTGELDKDSPFYQILGGEAENYYDLRESMQREMLQLINDKAYMSLDDDARAVLSKKISESMSSGKYNRREFQAFLDPDYVPPAGSRDVAARELAEEYMAANAELSEEAAMAKASRHLTKLEESFASARRDDPTNYFAQGIDSILKRKNENLGDGLMTYLGVLTDPAERVRGTLTGMAKSIARTRTDDFVMKELERVGLASSDKADNMVNLRLRGTTNKNPTNLFVLPQVQRALDVMYLPGTDRAGSNVFLNGLSDLYRSAVGASKATKVLLNTVAYPVQVYSNMATLMGAGLNPFKEIKRGAQLAGSEFAFEIDKLLQSKPLKGLGLTAERMKSDPSARKKFLSELREMDKYGIKGANILESDIRETFTNGVFSNFLQKPTNFFGRAYQVPDTTFRYVGWKGVQDELRSVFKRAEGQTQEAYEDAIKAEAARIINDTYQNYDKLSNTVRTLSKWGVMPQFASFTAEFARNQYNQGRIAMLMRGGKYKPLYDLGDVDLNAMKWAGRRRIASMVAVYGATYGAMEGLKYAAGIDSEKEEALRDVVYAPWDKNRSMMVYRDPETRKGWTANPSYVVPHSLGLSALRAGLDGDDATSVVGILQEEMVGEGSFVMQEIYRTLANKKKSGKPITNELDDFRAAQDKLKYFIAETFRPGFSRELKKATDAAMGRGDLSLKEVGARQLGARLNPFDEREAARFTVMGTNEVAKQAKSEYTSLIRFGEPTEAERRDAYEAANRIQKEAFDALVKNNNSLRVLGFDEAERVQLFKDAGVSSKQILGILDGKYTPLEASIRKTTSDVYAELPEGKDAKLSAIREIAKTDRVLANKLVNKLRSEVRKDVAGETPRESLLRGMDTEERARYIYENDIGNLQRYRRMGIASDSVVKAVRLLQKSER